ncbi:bifunctional diguanylate cyclase/phosphodiesterase [Roseovarius sp. MMSF_3281]|uniref:putative bifunctional diguanylate cyclase/phosphodiesterase n=1 Tax=Roseovarius sp. MMSF_3281 TaxID=3046694 RepID=UPI00273CF563|nr:bifunctional diguanylate cyclase/phosphodiesterase [Roseovarius sp. MMSF_3281]
MISSLSSIPAHLLNLVALIGRKPKGLAFLPAIVLASFWLGGEVLLLLTALGIPLLLAFADHKATTPPTPGEKQLESALGATLAIARRKAMKTASLVIEIDDHPQLLDRFGATAMAAIMAQTQDRLQRVVRTPDQVLSLDAGQLSVILAPTRHLDHDTALKLATRLQAAIEEPLTVDAASVYITASVGLCLNTALSHPTGEDFADATMLALLDARRNAPSGLRAYAPNLPRLVGCTETIDADIEKAFEAGQFKPWFQPQISTETGKISGFEALARWEHPARGMIPPSDFLPDLERTGNMERLGDKMLKDALSALKTWDEAGLDVPSVGVNFASDELRNPKLVDRVAWALDRHDLSPDRLSIEILETVVSTSSDDTISSNIRRLAELGCHIDLDDFGTGHASISSIRRFAVQRLKIDRSFVMKVDQDNDQKDMIAAILLMADRLGLDTVAEGVETAGEHAILAQLGCGHVQGYGIARPMPFERTLEWATDHSAKLQAPPVIGRKIV